jgi:hypothetical protein
VGVAGGVGVALGSAVNSGGAVGSWVLTEAAWVSCTATVSAAAVASRSEVGCWPWKLQANTASSVNSKADPTARWVWLLMIRSPSLGFAGL